MIFEKCVYLIGRSVGKSPEFKFKYDDSYTSHKWVSADFPSESPNPECPTVVTFGG